jgi:murein DD-endopeptidase MepM/ murein hydrolase activator NlpD
VIILLILLQFLFLHSQEPKYYLPVRTNDRKSINTLKITEIGEFGLPRKARPNVPAHLHTGIDIRRPSNNYQDEPIFPISRGIVISKRQDGPFAQIIIEHGDPVCWTVYEHIAGIKVNVNDRVNPDSPVARFMNKTELNKYGWQFDHFHMEILKIKPVRMKADSKNPDRNFSSYSLVCYTRNELNNYFYDPRDFLQDHMR